MGRKIILSRKGFDTSNGGIVSPIIGDDMISFPIPNDVDTDLYEDLYYKGERYSDILADLKYSGVETCHLDPDLDLGRRIEDITDAKWFPAFGQKGSSALYLKKNNVAKGDIFLFFGNFHRVEKMNGAYHYIHRSGDFYKDNDLQVIWGYLEVGEIISAIDKQKEVWWHPHSRGQYTSKCSNLIFKAADNLCFDKSRAGAGLLNYEEKRVLTLKGAKKATWKVNEVYDTDHIYGNRKNSAKNKDEGLYYAGIWQELVLKESENCLEWAKNIIL